MKSKNAKKHQRRASHQRVQCCRQTAAPRHGIKTKLVQRSIPALNFDREHRRRTIGIVVIHNKRRHLRQVPQLGRQLCQIERVAVQVDDFQRRAERDFAWLHRPTNGAKRWRQNRETTNRRLPMRPTASYDLNGAIPASSVGPAQTV